MQIYRSNLLPFAIIMFIIILWFSFFALVNSKDINSSIEGVLYFAGAVFIVILVISLTKIKITNTIIEYSEIIFLKKRAVISNIFELDRVSTYKLLPVFGYSLVIYYKTDELNKVIMIGEGQFSKQTIKSIIKDFPSLLYSNNCPFLYIE